MTDMAKVILVIIVTTLVIIYRPASAQMCFSAAGCNSADAVTATDADDCCINKDDGLYYFDGTNCMECITFGWLQSTFVGEERSIAHTVQGGYSKGEGALDTVDAFIELVQDPEASFHASVGDFGGNLFNSSSPIFLRRPDFGNTDIPITLAVDDIGQEGIERGILRMRIAKDSKQPPNTFFKRDLAVTINDTSTVSIGFSSVQYLSSESKEVITTSVLKTQTQLAHPVSLRVQSMTIDEALAMGLTIPLVEGVDITVNNTEERRRIPIRAKGEGVDFSTDAIDITFPADEGDSLTLQFDVDVPIVDDQIDEADREYFILHLSVVDDPLPELVLGTTVSVGEIADNDVLEIRFERMSYSYVEPEGFDPLEVDDIFMLKNIDTELTYRIFFQIVAEDATRNVDYESTLQPFSVLDVPPSQRRLQVFNPESRNFMRILPDGLPEGKETIQISSDPVNNPLPAYTRPQTLAITTLFILDDDNVTVGWEQTSYTVSESVGTFQAFYSVIFPTRTTRITNPFFMRVATVVGTADEDDYQRIRGSQQEQFITNTMRRASAEVTIRTDNLNEGVEEFSLELFLAQPQTGFFVIPSITTVTVLDSTIELTISFTGVPYRALENTGPMIFTVAVNVIGNAMLTTDVVVSFSTVDGSTPGRIALAGSDYVGRSNVLLTFNAATRSIDVPVNLIDDSVREGEEDFSGNLILVSDLRRVGIVRGTAVATIVDNESSAQVCFSAAGCNSADAVNATDADDCCINKDDGLYYFDGTNCIQCITFGWIQNTLEGQERSNAHIVQGGYSKGSGSTVDVFVELVQDPEASFHASRSDFGRNLLTSSPLSLRRPSFGNTNIAITLAVDDIAQEGTERGILRMRIAEDSEQPPNTFFKRDLAVTINDNTAVTIGFTSVRYVSSESNEVITTSVLKTQTQLAHPVSLRVQPMTIDEALTMGLTIPLVDGVDITVNNTEERRRIPIRAKGGGVDFLTDAVNITFPADERASLVLQIDAKVPIVDDQVDEADREYFILHLSPIDDPLPGLEFGTSISVGETADDDVLQIRFERSNYTYMEPQGFDIHSVEDIFMVKNIDTELTYRILFLITAGDATNLRDYETSIDDFSGTLLDFSPNLQRLQVFEQSTFFFILPDGLPEEEETVEISSEPIDDPGPAYTRPQTGAVTTIFILDDDNITVGWEQTSYNVSEGVGTFQAFYSVINPPSTFFISSFFFVRVSTLEGTAGEDDYRRIRGSQQEQVFSNTMRRANAEVTIRTDNVYEGVEEFSLDLFYPLPQTGFFVIPNIAIVTITDTTNLTIGFVKTSFRAMENMGPMLFTVGVIGDTTLSTDVVVSFSTMDGSTAGRIALAGSDYVGRSNVLLTFNAATRSIEVSVSLNDDSVYEEKEDFSGTLALFSNSQRVTIVQGSAVATIVDDEIIECLPLVSITNGFIRYAPDTAPNYVLGTVVTYSCNAGYVLDLSVGSRTRTCRDDDNAMDVIGEFDGQAPTCIAVECLELPALTNGVITYSPDTEAPYSLGTVTFHVCNQGYRLVGMQTQVCEDVGTAFGEFSGEPPVCESLGCPIDTYQGTLSTGENACVPCPANSISTVPNSQSCTCFSGYYRSDEEGPSYACTAPPSGCRNLNVFEERTRANTITVRWERPEITGRDDFYYNIFYSENNQTFTQHNTRPYVKRDFLVDYSLSGLRPLTSYTIRVTAENGVSDQEERGETRSCEVAGRTGDIRPNAPSLVLGLCSVVVWRGPNRAYGRVIGYDVNFVPSGSSNVTVSKGIREMFHIIGENEVPMAIRGSTQVQVRARVPFADGEWSKLVPVGCMM